MCQVEGWQVVAAQIGPAGAASLTSLFLSFRFRAVPVLLDSDEVQCLCALHWALILTKQKCILEKVNITFKAVTDHTGQRYHVDPWVKFKGPGSSFKMGAR